MNSPAAAVTREQTLSIFSQVMGLVAVTCGFAALGAYGSWGLGWKAHGFIRGM